MTFLKEDKELEGRLECSECGFNCYPNQKKLKDVYIWLSVDKQTGHEGMIAIEMGPHRIPMVACSSDRKMVLGMEAQIRRAVAPMKMGARLVRYSQVTVEKEVE